VADQGLLFIPDISGFTKFVNETEIEHSRIIIEELLENIINSNKIGLQVSEVEGDAVLFYRFGERPSTEALCKQVEDMFCNFQKQLKNYEGYRMCVCNACKNAINLSLKIITHYGEFSSYNVKDFSKLIGKDVIVAHQLLKNSIDLHEYWLATNSLMIKDKEADALPQWLQWQQGMKEMEQGHIDFAYCMLTQLKENIKPDAQRDRTLGEKKIKVLSVSRTINAGLISVFSIIGNLSLRHQWQDGVISVDKISHPIYHLGIKFRIVTRKGSTTFYSSSFNNVDDVFCLSETDESKTQSFYITLKELPGNTTSITLDLYLPDSWFRKSIFSLFLKKHVEKSMNTSLNNLQALAQNAAKDYVL